MSPKTFVAATRDVPAEYPVTFYTQGEEVIVQPYDSAAKLLRCDEKLQGIVEAVCMGSKRNVTTDGKSATIVDLETGSTMPHGKKWDRRGRLFDLDHPHMYGLVQAGGCIRWMDTRTGADSVTLLPGSVKQPIIPGTIVQQGSSIHAVRAAHTGNTIVAFHNVQPDSGAKTLKTGARRRNASITSHEVGGTVVSACKLGTGDCAFLFNDPQASKSIVNVVTPGKTDTVNGKKCLVPTSTLTLDDSTMTHISMQAGDEGSTFLNVWNDEVIHRYIVTDEVLHHIRDIQIECARAVGTRDGQLYTPSFAEDSVFVKEYKEYTNPSYDTDDMD
jgi:hypothetical protein